MRSKIQFRTLFASLLVLLPASLPGFAFGGTWDMSTEVDKMTSKPTRLAFLRSENSLSLQFPYAGDNMGTIMVRNKGGRDDVMVFVRKGQVLCPGYGDGCQVMVRFDDVQPSRYSAVGPADHDSTTFFINDTKRFIAGASKAKRILIQFTMYNAGLQTLEFSPDSPLVWGASASKKK